MAAAAGDWMGEGEEFEVLVEKMSDSISDGFFRGIEESKVATRIVDLFHGLQRRIDKLERELSDVKAERSKTEEQIDPPKTTAESSSGETVKTPATSEVPKKSDTRQPVQSMNFMPRTSADRAPATSGRPRARSRQPSRPTVIYRKDPRAAAKPEQPEPESGSDVCSEAECERAVLRRGLCSLHYQRMQYTERKSDQMSLSSGSFPPSPPPKKSSRKENKKGGTHGIFALLYGEKGRRIFAGLINQMKFDRADIVKKLNEQHSGMPGTPVEEEDVIRAIHYHKLGDALKKREGEIICRHLTKLKGSLVKTAQKIKLDLDQLKSRITDLDLDDEVSRVRSDFREELIERTSFKDKLDLALTKEKYLIDLGIEKELDESLRKELAEQIGKLEASELEKAAQISISDALELDERQFRRLVRRFGDEGPLAEILAQQPDLGEA